MSEPSHAWGVVQIAELVRVGEELLLRALRTLDVDACAAMPDDGAWTLGGVDADELCGLLIDHAEIAERLRGLAGQLPQEGVTATYADVRDGAAAALADGILDPAGVALTAAVVDVRSGWIALADALTSTDARSAWTDLTIGQLLGTFRGAERRLVRRVLADADVEADTAWADLADDATRRLAATLRSYAERC